MSTLKICMMIQIYSYHTNQATFTLVFTQFIYVHTYFHIIIEYH